MARPTFRTERIDTVGNVVTTTILAFTQVTRVTRTIFNNTTTETVSGSRISIQTKP